MGPSPRVEVLQSGARALRVLNQGFNHFIPIWPRPGKRGRRGTSEPHEEPLAKKSGKEQTKARGGDSSGTGAHYCNYLAQYLRRGPDSSVVGAVSHLLGKFTDDKLRAIVAGRLQRARASVGEMMAKQLKYANRKATAQLSVAAQMYVKAYPLASGEEAARKMCSLWGRQLTGKETESAQRSVAEYRGKNPSPKEFVRTA